MTYKSIIVCSFLLIYSCPLYAQPVFQWAKHIGGSSYDAGREICSDDAGNIYIGGEFIATADFDPGPGIFNMTNSNTASGNMFLCKLDNSGNFIWAKQIESAAPVYLCYIEVRGSELYISGVFQDSIDFDPGPGFHIMNSMGSFDIFNCKLDTSGNLIWAKQMGGIASDDAWGSHVDLNGNIYSTGKFALTADFDPGPGVFNMTSPNSWRTFVSKLDATGNFVWAKQFSGLSFGRSVTTDLDGNVFISGDFNDTVDFDPGPLTSNLVSAGGKDVFICKLDSSGNYLMAKSFGSWDADLPNSIAVDNNENILLTGHFNQTVDFDPGPGVYSLTSSGFADIFISKYDGLGNLKWAKMIGGPFSDDDVYSMYIRNDNIYLSGGFYLTPDFDPGTASFQLTSEGLRDAYLCQLDSSGKFIFAVQMGGLQDDVGLGITVDNNGNLMGTGNFTDSGKFEPLSGPYDLFSAGSSDVYIVKYAPAPNVITDPEQSTWLFISPNPASSGKIRIRHDGRPIHKLEIYDVGGKNYFTTNVLSGNEVVIDIPGLEPGIYFAKILTDNAQFCKSFVIIPDK